MKPNEIPKIDPVEWAKENEKFAFDSFDNRYVAKYHYRLHPDIYSVYARACHMCIIEDRNRALLENELSRMRELDSEIDINGTTRFRAEVEKIIDYLKFGKLGTRMNGESGAVLQGVSRNNYLIGCFSNKKKEYLLNRSKVIELLNFYLDTEVQQGNSRTLF